MSTLNSTVDALRLGDETRDDHALARAWALLTRSLERRRSRRELVQMDERMLKDIGLSRADSIVEGGKHFWQR